MAETGCLNFDPDILDKYATFKYFLDKGASGYVYGPIPWNGLQLAIKQAMFPDGKVADELKTRLEGKKALWTSIEHKHLMKIHSVDLSRLPKVMLIVMEFASGGSLNKTLRSLGSENRLPIDIVTDWAKQIAEGMLYLHERNILHRDLKSANILLMEPYHDRNSHAMMTLKIADFDDVKENDHTATMSFVGTCAYMAPEVLAKQWFSKASDVWSFGVVIWEMLSGDTPHKGLELGAIMLKSQDGKLDDLPLGQPFPEDYKLILNRCWKSTSNERLSFSQIVCVLQRMALRQDVTELLKTKFSEAVYIGDKPKVSDEAVSEKEDSIAKQDTCEKTKENRVVSGESQTEILPVSDEATTESKESSTSKQPSFKWVSVIRDKVQRLFGRDELPDGLTEKYKSDPVLVAEIRTKAGEERKKSIRGLTILDKELFVVSGMSSEVEVYDSMKLSFSHGLNLKELIDPRDIASCNKNKCLYIVDWKDSLGQSNEILRVDPKRKLIRKWSTGYDYGYGLSVTQESNVILTLSNENKLNKYSPDGQLIRSINLSSEAGIHFPLHAIKLSNGHFVISHCFEQHRVCVVDANGKRKKSFGGKRGPTIGQTNEPVYLAVDGNGFVMVVDQLNCRVLLLDSDLNFNKEILLKEKHKIRVPERILLDESSGRILVADNDGRILTFSFVHMADDGILI